MEQMEWHMRQKKPIVRLAISVACLAVASVVVRTQTLGTPERFTAAAINSNRGAAGNIRATFPNRRRWRARRARD